jgi:YidC/Oxa1 family membrane protein insertase
MMEIAWSKDGSHKSKRSTKFESNQFEPVLDQDEILHWVGIKNTYFCNVFLPDEPLNNIQVKNNFKPMSSGKPQAVPVVGIRGGEQVVGTFYIGPLDKNDLQSVNSHLSNLVNYGYTGKLTEWMFIALEKIYSYVGNWGWAIVILTIFIRMVMFPLTAPSIKSGYKMRKIQPKLDAIKKKYSGKDMESKQKLSQETWKLYKQEKVNPFSSCITILPQMPIFIAYFSLLRTSISLRQSGWMFWINDLALKDPYFILPLIWGASMYLSQTMTPMPGDPSQQKMMKYMPVMMTLLFITMPSGLVLYMVTSNLFQLAQTVLFKWRYDKA